MDTSKRKILIFSDKKEKWQALSDYIESRGYVLYFLRNESEVFNKLRSSSVDLILLDQALHNLDHLEFTRRIKDIQMVPVILTGDPASDTEKVLALEMGADDYLSSDLSVEEMTARLKASLRLVEDVKEDIIESTCSTEKGRYYFAGWILDTDQHKLYDKDENEIPLTKGEFDLLTTFAKAPGRALSRDQLFDMVRDKDYEGFDRSIDVQISRLREKMGEKEIDNNNDPSNGQILRTVRGIGYMLDTQVKKI